MSKWPWIVGGLGVVGATGAYILGRKSSKAKVKEEEDEYLAQEAQEAQGDLSQSTGSMLFTPMEFTSVEPTLPQMQALGLENKIIHLTPKLNNQVTLRLTSGRAVLGNNSSRDWWDVTRKIGKGTFRADGKAHHMLKAFRDLNFRGTTANVGWGQIDIIYNGEVLDRWIGGQTREVKVTVPVTPGGSLQLKLWPPGVFGGTKGKVRWLWKGSEWHKFWEANIFPMILPVPWIIPTHKEATVEIPINAIVTLGKVKDAVREFSPALREIIDFVVDLSSSNSFSSLWNGFMNWVGNHDPDSYLDQKLTNKIKSFDWKRS